MDTFDMEFDCTQPGCNYEGTVTGWANSATQEWHWDCPRCDHEYDDSLAGYDEYGSLLQWWDNLELEAV